MFCPLVSIIVPVYNTEKYLRKCLDSIINQTLHDIEILCVNDGTKDNSAAILNEYAAKDSRIKIINKKNGGLSSARNEGLRHATAEFIGFVDSDDWIEPDTYELAYNRMINNNVDLVCWYAKMENENNLMGSEELKNAQEYHKIKDRGLFTVTDNTFTDCTVTVWNKLYKKALIEKYAINFPNGLRYEDTEFFMKYALVCSSVFFIGKYLYHYLQRNNSIMQIQNAKKEPSTDRIQTMENLYWYFEKNNLLPIYKKTISKVLTIYSFSGEVRNNDKRYWKKIFRYSTRCVKKFDLTLLEDPDNIFYYLQKKNYAALFRFFNPTTFKDVLRDKLHNTMLWKTLKTLYHKTSRYKIKALQRQLEQINQRINKLVSSQKIAVLDRVVQDYVGLVFDDLYKHNKKTTGPFDTINSSNSFPDSSSPINPNDREQLTGELKSLEEGGILFCPNNGNLGDIIIAESEYQFFASIDLKYRILDIYDSHVLDSCVGHSNYVYGGGGIFTGPWDYRLLQTIFKLPHFKKIIILPSSFCNCDELLEVFDTRFVVLCREEKSYNYCVSMNKKAKFILSHDMAFHLHSKSFTCGPISFQDSARLEQKHYLPLYKSWVQFIITSDNIKKAVNEKVLISGSGEKIGFMLRTDAESNIQENEKGSLAATNLDLSSYGWNSCSDPGIVKALSLLFFHALNYFDCIITDRLHIGIVSALLGKKVYLIDNSYGKLSGVYKQSFKNYKNVKMIDDISQFIIETDKSVSPIKSDTKYPSYNTEMTFKEFLAIYFSVPNSDYSGTNSFLNEVNEWTK